MLSRIRYLEEEKTITVSRKSKSVRLDVYVEDEEETVYNVEMQVSNPGNLPKRSRYYQGMMDLNLMEKGENYAKLKKSYVIFICMEDVFGKGRPVYTFENTCQQDTSIRLGDETTKIFLIPKAARKETDEALRNFLLYLEEGIHRDAYTGALNEAVERVRENKEWRVEYMTLYMLEQEKYEEGRLIGLEEGRQEQLKSVGMMIKALRESGIEEERILPLLKKTFPKLEEEIMREYCER